MHVSAVDLYCGAGGLTHGLQQAGINVQTGYDIEPLCKFPYETNNEGVDFIEKDVAKLTSKELANQYPDKNEIGDDVIRILAGCAPCQPYSALSNSTNSKGNHKKEELLQDFADLIDEDTFLPEIVTMENVVRVQNAPKYEYFVNRLENLGYKIDARPVYCPEYGVPQTRKRWVLLASQYGPISLNPPLYEEGNYPTVRDAIGGENKQPEMDAGDDPPDNDPLHRSRGLAKINRDRMRISEPGETWELWKEKNREDLLLECHKRESGNAYTDNYGIMEWDEVGPTITTYFHNYGAGRFGHPDDDQIRAISLREGAMLQTFPDDYEFHNFEADVDFSMDRITDFIGNAVPPQLGKVIGQSINNHLQLNSAKMENDIKAKATGD